MSILNEEEQEAARARQARRYREASALKQYEEREHLRGEIPSRHILEMNSKIMEVFVKGEEDVIMANGTVETRELDRTRVSMLKAASEIGFKMLSKTVPDLKQIELRADVSEEALPQAITFHVVKALADDE